MRNACMLGRRVYVSHTLAAAEPEIQTPLPDLSCPEVSQTALSSFSVCLILSESRGCILDLGSERSQNDS